MRRLRSEAWEAGLREPASMLRDVCILIKDRLQYFTGPMRRLDDLGWGLIGWVKEPSVYATEPFAYLSVSLETLRWLYEKA